MCLYTTNRCTLLCLCTLNILYVFPALPVPPHGLLISFQQVEKEQLSNSPIFFTDAQKYSLPKMNQLTILSISFCKAGYFSFFCENLCFGERRHFCEATLFRVPIFHGFTIVNICLVAVYFQSSEKMEKYHHCFKRAYSFVVLVSLVF